MAVHLDRPPHSAFLVVWGRAPDAWWGCVQFRQAVGTPDGTDELAVAAWVPAASLRKPGWANHVAVPRIELARDRTTWPAPPGWPAWYAGPWSAGTLTLPAGVQAVTGPAWRRRGRRQRPS